MKRFSTGLVFILFTFQSWTQDVRLDWVKTAGNPPLQDNSYGLSVDDSGNVYTTGFYALTADLNTDVGVEEYTAVGGTDIFIHKVDNNGNFKWVKSIGGSLSDSGYEIVTDSEGYVYVTGVFAESADFDPNEGVYTLTASGGSSDAFVLKLDSLGNLIWAKSFGGELTDRGNSIAVDNLGNVYVTGVFRGTADFDPGIDTFNLISEGAADIYVLKLDVDGNFLWANGYGGSGTDFGWEVMLDNFNNIYITGYYSETIDFNPDGPSALETSLGGEDGFILKLDNDGEYLWSHSIGGPSISDSGNSINIDAFNDVFIVGQFRNTVDFDPGVSDSVITAVDLDGYILKLNSEGEFEWVCIITGENEELVNKIVLNTENEIFVTGRFSETTDFDPGEGVYELDAGMFRDDVYLLKLDASGEFIWVKQYDSNDLSGVHGLDIDDSSNIFVSGYFEGTMDFDPGADTLEITAPMDNDDFFILKMAPCTPFETTDTIEACNSYTWIDGIEYFESTTDPVFILSDTSGCDSIVSLHLTILPTSSTTDVIEACDAYTWIDGIEYTEDNDEAVFTLTNEFGCDSVVALNLTILSSSTGIDVLTACDSLLWTDGITYYEDNFTATDTLVNVVGCDSVVTLNLSVNYSNTGIDEQTACDSLVWIDGITYYEDNDEATFTLTNIAGCDSVVALNLIVNYSSSGTDEQTACESYIWIDGVEYVEDNTTATFILTNALGCDSVVTLNLDIDPIDVGVTNDDPTLTALETDAEYQWLDCINDFSEIPGATEISFVPDENGDYAIRITKAECVDTSDCYTIETAGLFRPLENNTINLYPNPSNGLVNIDLGDIQAYSIQVMSVNGVVIYSETVNLSGVFQIQLNATAGLYFVDVLTEHGNVRVKLVVE